jgi:hypothetical protein
MALIADGAFDAALNYIKNGLDRLDICTQQPATAAAARTNPAGGNSLGNEVISSSNTTGPQDGDVDGRELQMNAIADGDVTATGNATHWAISNSTVLLAAGTLASSQRYLINNLYDSFLILGRLI